MRDLLKGWRRKAELVTLMAFAFMAVWIRSQIRIDLIELGRGDLVSGSCARTIREPISLKSTGCTRNNLANLSLCFVRNLPTILHALAFGFWIWH